jgi:TonB family protein
MAERLPLPRPPRRLVVGPGPALRRAPLPLTALVVSALAHGLGAAAVVAMILWGGWRPSRVHVVNLVPTVAAVGLPTAPPRPALPPRPTPLPATARAPAPEPTPREPRPREAPRLPDAPLPTPPREPPRSPALPRPGEKELPPLAAPRTPAPSATARAGESAESRPAPPPGQITGTTSGSGALTLDVSDFPHAWYLRQVLQKVEESWHRQGLQTDPPVRPLVFVEIHRNGRIGTPRIEKSSGDSFYDRAAVRAIMEASPFPPLPEDWTRPDLRVLFRFELRARQG